MVYLWRAVDAEGEVLDVLVQSRRNKRAALKLMRKLLKKYGFVPDKLVTDDLKSYAAAASELSLARRHERGRWRNNRAENSHQPTRRREYKMQRVRAPPAEESVEKESTMKRSGILLAILLATVFGSALVASGPASAAEVSCWYNDGWHTCVYYPGYSYASPDVTRP